jgi:hypothetical protein
VQQDGVLFSQGQWCVRGGRRLNYAEGVGEPAEADRSFSGTDRPRRVADAGRRS